MFDPYTVKAPPGVVVPIPNLPADVNFNSPVLVMVTAVDVSIPNDPPDPLLTSNLFADVGELIPTFPFVLTVNCPTPILTGPAKVDVPVVDDATKYAAFA